MMQNAEPVALSAWYLTAVLGGAVAIRIIFFAGPLGLDGLWYLEEAGAFRSHTHAFVPSGSSAMRYGLLLPLAAVQMWFGQSEHVAALVPLC